MRKASVIGLAAASVLALVSCTDGGAGQGTSPTATTTETSRDKAYSEDELRELISGMQDAGGNELKLYSKEQVGQGGNVAQLFMTTAKVEPEDCKSIATAGLLDEVENGDVAVAISESAQPRTLSAQSSSDGPDAVELLNEVSGKMDQCSSFSVEVMGQRLEVSSEELQAETDGEETFATVSTRGEGGMIMQVSAAEGRLLVVATKGGADLGDPDQKELEDLVNEVLARADDAGTATATVTSSPTGTATVTVSPTPTSTASPTTTETGASPSPTGTASPTGTP